MKYYTNTPEETIQLGAVLGRSLPKNSVVCLSGDLAAGKTTLIKGLAAEVSGCSFDEVNSPTFVYLNIYKGITPVYHFDLYRLHDADEFLSMGFDEYFYCGGICCIEWANRIEGVIPSDALRVTLRHDEKGGRVLEMERNI